LTPLRDFLLDANGGFADRRCKDRSQDLPIKIDDQGDHDVFPYFCTISVRVPERNGDSLVLKLQYAPLNADARELIEDQGGELENTPRGTTVTLQLRVTNVTFIRKLARTIRNTVGRGKRYANPNWKWMCGRTADSLDRFADVLMAYRSERRSHGGRVRQPPDTSGIWEPR
jgi:hypothetical protein